MACTLAGSPSDPFHRKLRQLRCLCRRFDCYRVERTSSWAGVRCDGSRFRTDTVLPVRVYIGRKLGARGRPKRSCFATLMSLIPAAGVAVQHSPKIVIAEGWHSAHSRICRFQQWTVDGRRTASKQYSWYPAGTARLPATRTLPLRSARLCRVV